MSRYFDGWWGKGTLNSISSFHPYSLPFEAAASQSSLPVTVQGVGLCTHQQSPEETSLGSRGWPALEKCSWLVPSLQLLRLRRVWRRSKARRRRQRLPATKPTWALPMESETGQPSKGADCNPVSETVAPAKPLQWAHSYSHRASQVQAVIQLQPHPSRAFWGVCVWGGRGKEIPPHPSVGVLTRHLCFNN